jgi:hypothetical protein
MHMLVAVQNELGPNFRQDIPERTRIEQSLALAARFAFGWMMDEYDTKQVFVAQRCQQLCEPPQLRAPKSPGCHQGRRWDRGRKADQRDARAPADEWPFGLVAMVGAHVITPARSRIAARGRYIRIVVARNDADTVRWTEVGKPSSGRSEFVRQCDIHEIAGQRDVIRQLGTQIRHDAIKRAALVNAMPFALPVQISKQSL